MNRFLRSAFSFLKPGGKVEAEGLTFVSLEMAMNRAERNLNYPSVVYPVRKNRATFFVQVTFFYKLSIAGGNFNVFHYFDECFRWRESEPNMNATAAQWSGPPASHPGLLIMVFVGVIMAAALALTVQHVRRTRRDEGYVLQDQEMEIPSISGASSDLW